MVGRVPSRGSDQFVVRMPDGMRDQISKQAEKNGRSMNAEIIARIALGMSVEDDLTAVRAELAGFKGRAEIIASVVDVMDAYKKEFRAQIDVLKDKLDSVEANEKAGTGKRRSSVKSGHLVGHDAGDEAEIARLAGLPDRIREETDERLSQRKTASKSARQSKTD